MWILNVDVRALVREETHKNQAILFLDARQQFVEGLRGCGCEELRGYFEICAQPVTYVLEELDFGGGKERGGLAEIVKKMFDNSLQEFWRQADKGARAVVPGLKVAFGKVSAFGTSKFHFGCGGVIDRRESSDVGRCRRCGQVVDAHLNASKNFAHDHARYAELVGNNPRDVGGGGEGET